MKEHIIKALEALRKEKQRKFDQSVEVIINLQKFDIKKESVNLFVQLPFLIKERKVCGFLTKKSPVVDTITKAEFDKYKSKKDVKKLTRSYNFFIAHASLMPSVATTFGKYLGPAGKMPSPQLGIVTNEDEATLKSLLEKVNHIARVKSKEPSLKVPIGKSSMKDEEIAQNALQVYTAVLNAVTKEKIKSVLIKFTMTKPMKIQL